MKILKQIIFFTLAIIFIPLILIGELVYGNTPENKTGGGWYQKLWGKGYKEKIIFILLLPFFGFLVIFLNLFYPLWDKLGKLADLA